MKIIILKCGHKPNAFDAKDNTPCCAICFPSRESREVKEEVDLNGRECSCDLCGSVCPSEKHLAFFEYRPTEKYDRHYDGCRGWE